MIPGSIISGRKRNIYQIARSLRFNSADSAYLSRTPGGAGNQKTWTYSFWFKPAKITQSCMFLWTNSARWRFYTDGTASGGASDGLIQLDGDVIGGTGVYQAVGNYRDPTAWYHIVLQVDTTQASNSDRVKLYINGSLVSWNVTGTITQNADTGVNAATLHQIGLNNIAAARPMDGYLTEVYMIDGQALTPSSFGQTNPTTGIWEPKRYSGTYGTNGFKLNFSDNSNTTSGTLGKDSSGNGNDWTPNNFSVTAGAGNDSLTDTPTNYGTDTGAGGEVRGNFPVLNMIAGRTSGATPTISNGGLQITSINNAVTPMTFGAQTGKWIFEMYVANSSGADYIGVMKSNDQVKSDPTSLRAYTSTGKKISSSWPGSVYGATFTTGDTITALVDLGVGEIAFKKNGTSQGTAFTDLTVGEMYSFILDPNAGGILHINTGQRPFDYPEAGYKALCTQNLPTPAIKKPSNHFRAVTYTGNGGALQVGNIVKSQSTTQISRSLRFNSADSAYLDRTTGTGTSNKIGTWSFWIKRTSIDSRSFILGDGTNDASSIFCEFQADNTLAVYDNSGGKSSVTTQLFRDPTAWMHIVFFFDTPQATSTDRFKLYVNGTQVTSFSSSSYPAQNSTLNWGISGIGLRIGRSGSSIYSNFYLTEFHYVDGQALTPSSFGETDANGNWVAKTYSGSYGTNGFYLNFSDNSGTTSTTLGKDNSGNGNNWTPNNFSVTAGAGNDSLVDTPTGYGIDTGQGGEVRGNYATWSSIGGPGSSTSTLTPSNGNLDLVAANSGRWGSAIWPMSSGKWFWEVTIAGAGVGPNLGIVSAAMGKADNLYLRTPAVTYYGLTGNRYKNNDGGSAFGATYGAGDVIGVAFDADNLTVQFYKNGASQGTVTGVTAGTYYPAFGTESSPNTGSLNAGQRAFSYTAPSGFKSLCDQNLAAFGEFVGSPNLVWIKGRSGATDHALYDTSRGATLDLASNSTAAESTEVNGLQKFGRDGFYIGNLAKLNTSDATYVAWLWNESVVAGFDIVTYTGNGSNRAISHNLNATPQFMIFKSRSTTNDWAVYHASNTSAPATDYLLLNSTAATADDDTYWNDTAPTSTQFTVGTNTDVNTNTTTYVAYLWAPIAGFSAFSSYTGNGSADGPVIATGFLPAWYMSREYTTTGNWWISDRARSSYNVTNAAVRAESSGTETTAALELDFLSMSAKVRTNDANRNRSGGSYIFGAFAQDAGKYSRAV